MINTGYATYKLTIPAGTLNGTKFVMNGKGPLQDSGLPPGDLICRTHVHCPPEWNVNNEDLYIMVQVDYLEAITGTVVKFRHLDDKQFEVKVPKNTAPDSRLKMQGKGMPNPRTGRVGNLFVIVKVSTPNLTEEQLRKLTNFIDEEL